MPKLNLHCCAFMKNWWHLFFSGCFYPMLFILTVSQANAQYYLSGTDGGSVRWEQLRGNGFRVIFPQHDSARALDYLNAFSMASPLVSKSLLGHSSPLDVILHPFSTRSNALTVWAPSRIDVFPVPPGDSYAQSWPGQLALHELRHVVQLTSLNRGATRWLSGVFGEHVTGLVFGLHVPRWFAEGDAVYSETVFSESGRGRDPLFRMYSRAWAGSVEKKSYNQLLFGSFRRFNPGAYSFGYEMVTGIRNGFNTGLWDSVSRFVASHPWQPFAFSAGLKRYTQLTTSSLFISTLNDLKCSIPLPEGLMPVVPDQVYADYYRPFRVAGSRVAAVRSVYGEVDDVVVFDSTGCCIQRVCLPGSIDRESFTAAGKYLVWTETENHSRWEHRQSSVVWYHDLQEGTTKRLRKLTRWFMPALSPDGDELAVVEINKAGQEFLVLMSFPEGVELKRVAMKRGDHLVSPGWAQPGNIIALLLSDGGKCLVNIDLNHDSVSHAFRFGYRFALSPGMLGGRVALTTDHEERAVVGMLEGDSVVVLCDTGYGVHQVSAWNNHHFLCNVYTPEGYRVLKAPFPKGERVVVRPGKWAMESRLAAVEQELTNPNCDVNREATAVKSRYRRAEHLFRFHSWAPVALNVDDQEVKPGITLLSQNSLSSMVAALGYRYLEAPGNHELFANIQYYGLFPVLGAEASFARRSTDLMLADTSLVFNWSQSTVNLLSSVPLRWNHGSDLYNITPAVSFKGEWLRADDGSVVNFNQDAYLSMNYSLYLAHSVRSSINDFYPRQGQAVYLLYRHSPFATGGVGEMTSVEGWVYLPGFYNHHGIKIYGGYEHQPERNNYFGFALDFPRGYRSFRLPNRIAGSVTYAFPIACPDWDLRKLAYVSRVSGRAFYDINLAGTSAFQYTASSLGVELHAEGHALRLVSPLQTGLRFSWLVEEQSVAFDWLFTLNLDAF